MKFAVIDAAVLSSIPHAGCFETTSPDSAGRAPDSLFPKSSPLEGQGLHTGAVSSVQRWRVNVAVIITIRPGFQVRVLVNLDLVLAAYQG
jgi:type IV secretory pathway VirB10-like protein